MSLVDTLAKEHDLFAGWLNHLENALRTSDERSVSFKARSILAGLLPALDRHEEIENLIFHSPAYAAQWGAARLVARMSLQHAQIEALKGEAKKLLEEDSGQSLVQLQASVFLLVRKLRLHFEMEEGDLWPHYRRFESRSLGQSIDHRTRERVQALERDFWSHWLAFTAECENRI